MALPSMNIGGLMSGLDTNGIIKGLIDVERIPIGQLKSRRSLLTAKDNAWQDISTRFSAIRTALNAIDSDAERRGFVAAASSNETAATATASSTAATGSITFSVDRLATTHRVATNGFGSSTDLVGAGDFTITIDGVDHTVTADATTTWADLAQDINALDAGVSATILSEDGSTNRLLLTADESGAGGAFTVASTMPSVTSSQVVEAGEDAQLTIGSGATPLVIERGSNTITDLLDGVTIDLHAAGGDPVTVSVDTDLDASVGAVESLLDEINSSLGRLGTLTAYNSESERGGVLVGDSTARALQIDLRGAVSGTVAAGATTYAVPSSIGVSLNRDGSLDVDTAKLRAAMEDNPDEALDLVGAIADRLGSLLDDVEGSSGRISRARSNWQSQIDLVDDRINQLEDRIDRHEAQLVRQFSGLETAMATLSSQASWLSAQIGSMSTGGGG